MGQRAIGHRHDGYGIAPGCVNAARAGAVREIVRVRYDDENSEPLATVAYHLFGYSSPCIVGTLT